MRNLTACLALALLASTPCFADYNGEIGAGSGKNTVSDDALVSDLESTYVSAFLQVFIGDISTDKGPRLEAGFLNKGTFFSVDLNDGDDTGIDSGYSRIGVHIVNNLDFIFEVEAEDDDFLFGKSRSVGFGSYIGDNFAWKANYESYKDLDFRELSGSIHGVLDFSSMSLSYDAIIGYVDSDNDSGFLIGGGSSLFFTKNLSLGLDVRFEEINADDFTTITVSGDYFLYDIYHFSLSYEALQVEDTDFITTLFTASVRF